MNKSHSKMSAINRNIVAHINNHGQNQLQNIDILN